MIMSVIAVNTFTDSVLSFCVTWRSGLSSLIAGIMHDRPRESIMMSMHRSDIVSDDRSTAMLLTGMVNDGHRTYSNIHQPN